MNGRPTASMEDLDEHASKRAQELRTLNLSKGRVVLNGRFDETVMEAVYFEILRLSEDANTPEITLYVNSNGGYLSALLPLVDLIGSCGKPVATVAMGKAYSCAAILLLCGKHGRRAAHAHTEILLHEVASSPGHHKSSQATIDAKHLERLNNQLVFLLNERTRMTPAQIDRYMASNKDEFMTAREALRMGLIDRIL